LKKKHVVKNVWSASRGIFSMGYGGVKEIEFFGPDNSYVRIYYDKEDYSYNYDYTTFFDLVAVDYMTEENFNKAEEARKERERNIPF
jgi:hypothetical protein